MKKENITAHSLIPFFLRTVLCLTGWQVSLGLTEIHAFAEEMPYMAEGDSSASTWSYDAAVQGPEGENSADQVTESGIYTAVDGNQIPEDRLKDNIVEYDEIGSLVHYYNTDVRIIMEDNARSKQDYTEIKNEHMRQNIHIRYGLEEKRVQTERFRLIHTKLIKELAWQSLSYAIIYSC